MAQLLLGDLDLLAGPYAALVGTDWGSWQAVTTTTESLYVDGSVVAGETSGNRTIALQVRVEASTRTSLVAACEALFAQANEASNTLTFIPDGGGAWVVYDVFRAQPERTDDQSEAWLRRTYTFTIPAKPFPRSPSSVTVAAAAPGTILASFDAATTGVDIAPPKRAVSGVNGPWKQLSPTGGATDLPTLFNAQVSSLTALVNCTYTAGTELTVTATATGLVEASHGSSFAVSGAVVAVSLGNSSSDVTRPHCQAGIEWINSSGSVLGVDWSEPEAMVSTAVGSGFGPYFAAPRPAAATKARIRLRVPDARAGVAYTFSRFTMADVTAATMPLTTTSGAPFGPHDGPAAVWTGFPGDTVASGGWVWSSFAAPVSLANSAAVSVWRIASIAGTTAHLTLFDTAGRWSRWPLTFASTAANEYRNASVDLSDAPSATSTAGAADLSAVASFALQVAASDSRQGMAAAFDTLMAGPKNTVLTTQHGSVVELNITGSARSTVAMTVSNTVAMTDCLLAAADVEVSPMLPVASSVATAVAPAAYDGVYRVIGALVPASTEASPTCVVNQLVGGVSVATQTLTGTMQTGNHYCDFGAVALPLVGYPDDNQAVSYTFTLTPSDTDWAEVLVLDVDQPMVWLPNMSTSRSRMWVDEPDALAQLGRVWVGSAADRSDARSPSTPPDLSRPFQVQCPSVRLLAYSTSGAPDVSLTYFPHWLVEPLE